MQSAVAMRPAKKFQSFTLQGMVITQDGYF